MDNSFHISNLKVIILNINSLISNIKRAELSVFLKTHKPHIMLLSETKIKKNHKIMFKNYNIIRNDRSNNQGGGTAILVKNTINFDILPNNLTSQALEYTAIKLNLANNKSIYIFSIYVNNQNHDHIGHDLDKLIRVVPRTTAFIIGGDFNARHISWQNSRNNYNGLKLRDWLDLNNQRVRQLYSRQPTYVAGNRRSYIDFFIVESSTNIPLSSNLLETFEFHSDHRAVQFYFQNNLDFVRNTDRFKKNYNRADWFGFWMQSKYLLENLTIPTNRNLSPTEINEYLEKVTSIIAKCETDNVPLTKMCKEDSIHLSDSTIALITYKNQLRKRYYRSTSSNNRPLLKSLITNLVTMIRNNIQYNWEKQIQNTLTNMKKDRDVFKNINRLSKRKPFPIIPDLTTDIK